MDRRVSSQIVPEIYEATIVPAHWDHVVTIIAKLTRSRVTCLYYNDKKMEMASTIAQHGLPEDQRVSFSDQSEALDDIFSASDIGTLKDPECIQFHPGSNNILPIDSKFHLNWMKPNDIYYAGGAQFIDTKTHKAGIMIMRSKEDGPWDDGEIRVVSEILPHLGRALKIHAEFTCLRLKQDALLKGLDRLVIGLILYDRHAQPVYINPTAKAIINNHPALQLQDDALLLISPVDEKKLRKIIIDIAEIDLDDSWKQSVAIGIVHPDVDAPLPLLVTPMHANLIASDLDYEGAKVAVFMSDPNLQQPISIDNLVSVYSLTPSEAQVAISLTNGHSIDQIASNSNHSTHTIRSQLKSVFRKTNVSRQSELMKLLLTGPFAQRRRSVGP